MARIPFITLSRELELEAFVTIPQAAKLRGVSVPTLTRTDSDKFVKLSPNRNGMRLRDALLLPAKTD